MEYDICMLANDELSDIVCVSYLLRNHVGMLVNKLRSVCVCVCVGGGGGGSCPPWVRN